MLRRISLQKLLNTAIIASLLMAFIPFSTGFAAPASHTAICTIDGLAVRKGPGTRYDLIGTLHSGDIITVLQEKNGWYRFDFSGKTGWSSGKYLALSGTADAPMPERIGTAACNASNTKVRFGPGTSYQAYGILQKDQLLNLYGQSEDWFQIGYGTGLGWIQASYLKDIRLIHVNSNTSTSSPQAASVPSSSSEPSALPDTSSVIGTAVASLTKGLLNVRSGPGTGYNRIGIIDNKASYDVYAEQGEWLCIQLGEQKGWIGKAYVTFTRTTDPSASLNKGIVDAPLATDEKIDDSTPIGAGLVNTISGSLSVHKGPGTQYKVISHIAMGETVDIMSISGNWYYISYDGKFGYVSKSFIKVMQVEQETASFANVDPIVAQIKGTVHLIQWFGTGGARAIWPKGTYFTMVDVRTGTVMRMKYWCGTNHADIEPATKVDTAALKKSYGGHWSWKRRPVWVIINGQAYAGSINGMPHGGDSLPSNGMNGQICLHFVGSETHCDGQVDPVHQATIQEAYLAGK